MRTNTLADEQIVGFRDYKNYASRLSWAYKKYAQVNASPPHVMHEPCAHPHAKHHRRQRHLEEADDFWV